MGDDGGLLMSALALYSLPSIKNPTGKPKRNRAKNKKAKKARKRNRR